MACERSSHVVSLAREPTANATGQEAGTETGSQSTNVCDLLVNDERSPSRLLGVAEADLADRAVFAEQVIQVFP